MLKIVVVQFPFLDNVTRKKRRPALCLTKPSGKYQLVVLAYISTQFDLVENYDILLEPSASLGLKHVSLVKLNKIISISVRDIEGEIGTIKGKSEREIKKKLKKLFDL